MKGISSPPSKSVDYIHIVDKKSDGNDGGDFIGDAWQTRVLTDIITDTGNHASLAANQITLAAGTYRCLISCPACQVAENQARLYNITDTEVTLLGSCEDTSVGDTGSRSFIVGQFIIAAPKVLEIQHFAEETKNAFGLGHALDDGSSDEIFTIAEFWKVG